jgi:ligand-binding sensor protein
MDNYNKLYSPHAEALTHCIESDTNSPNSILYRKSKLYKCKNGMWNIVTPLKLGGQHFGDIHTGQFFFEGDPVDHKFLLSQYRQKGFNEKEYMAMLEIAPRLDRGDVDKITGSLLDFAKVIDDKYLACPLVWAVSRLKNSLFDNSS